MYVIGTDNDALGMVVPGVLHHNTFSSSLFSGLSLLLHCFFKKSTIHLLAGNRKTEKLEGERNITE